MSVHPRLFARPGRFSTLSRLACGSLLALLPACNSVLAETSLPNAGASTKPAWVRPSVEPNYSIDLRKTLGYLASDELEGRGVGTAGLDKAGEFIADHFAKLGLQPLPDQQDFFQNFTFSTGLKVDPKTTFAAGEGKPWLAEPKLGTNYQPMTITAEGAFDAPVVWGGYAIASKEKQYDDFADLDVKGKVVLAMRFEPVDAEGKSRFTGKKDDFSPNAAILAKANAAKDRGAVALLLVTPPTHHEDQKGLMNFARSMGFDRAPIPVVQIDPDTADALLKAGGAGALKDLQAKIDDTGKPQAVALKDVSAKGDIKLSKTERQVRNVVAVLPGKGPHADEFVVIGSHYDHLGHGGPGSLSPLSKDIHHGADDNASGTTAMMKLAEHFAHVGPQPRTLVFMAFTAEELGLIGSEQFVNKPPIPLNKISAMFNLDMVGRLKNDKLSVGGLGTAPSFEKIVEEAVKETGLKTQGIGKGGLSMNAASDHISFAKKKIPVLFFFTGLHSDYHRPTDTADKINYEGMDKVVAAGVKVIESLASIPREDYVAAFDNAGGGGTGSAGGGTRVSLGVVPDYSDDTIKGVRITGTSPGSPAEKAGLKDGDVITGFDDKRVGNLQDLFQNLSEAKPGDKVKLKLLRGGKETETEATLVERK